MNEHQLNYNSDFQNQDFASEQQHLSPDLMEDYNQDSLTDPTHTEQPWEQLDQTDYTQPDFNAAKDYSSSGYDAMEIQSNSYGSDLSGLNNSHDTIQYDSVSYEQSTYSLEHNSFDNALDTQDYNNNLWEQQYQKQSVSSYGDVSFSQQKSGHDPTAEDLSKANELDAQARDAETHYKDDTSWANSLENENHPDAHIYYESAEKYKKQAEDLQAQVKELRQ